ncbi:MAG TPA: ribonucleotide-diphosphate reductase subunit beta [Nitrosopumilaceae archaeon]|nr:ribonucleotide-diphosphate reductase subunit beta [Nitrosopumilaceae archaeon]
MHFVILTEIGVAVFDKNTCVKSLPFSDLAKEYVEIKEGKANVYQLTDFLSKLPSPVFVNDSSLLKLLKKNSIEAELMENAKIENIQASKLRVLVDSGFAKDEDEARAKLRDFAVQLSSSKVTETSESPDLHIIQTINTLDEIDKIINGLSSRLREWYGLHFPELDNLIDSISGYSRIVLAGTRDDITDNVYIEAGFPDTKVEMLSLLQKKSKGGKISEENLAIVQFIAKQILELFELRNTLEKHVETQMDIVAPNLAGILGHAVGARILARAGSLKRLGSMPASTIQVLGAEKALFRSLKTGSQPPKHGLLFQHSLVHAAPRWQRGKIARAISTKAAIAARVDVFGAGLNKTLFEKLNVRIKEISEKYKEPTEKQPMRIQQRDTFRHGRGPRSFGRDSGSRDRKKDWKKGKRRKFGKR